MRSARRKRKKKNTGLWREWIAMVRIAPGVLDPGLQRPLCRHDWCLSRPSESTWFQVCPSARLPALLLPPEGFIYSFNRLIHLVCVLQDGGRSNFCRPPWGVLRVPTCVVVSISGPLHHLRTGRANTFAAWNVFFSFSWTRLPFWRSFRLWPTSLRLPQGSHSPAGLRDICSCPWYQQCFHLVSFRSDCISFMTVFPKSWGFFF